MPHEPTWRLGLLGLLGLLRAHVGSGSHVGSWELGLLGLLLVSMAAYAFVCIRSEIAARRDSHLSAAFTPSLGVTTLGNAGARNYARLVSDADEDETRQFNACNSSLLVSDADEDGMDGASGASGASGARGRAGSKSCAEATTPEPPPSPRAGGQVASFFIARRGSRSGMVGDAPSPHSTHGQGRCALGVVGDAPSPHGSTAHRGHSDSTPTTGTAQARTAQAPASSDPMLPALREEWPAPPSRRFRFLDETQEAADNLMFEADRRAHELLFEAQREADAILNAARRISAAHSPSSLPRSRISRPASHTPGAHENDYLDRDPSPSVDHSQAF